MLKCWEEYVLKNWHFFMQNICVFMLFLKINSFDMLYDPSKCMCKWFFMLRNDMKISFENSKICLTTLENNIVVSYSSDESRRDRQLCNFLKLSFWTEDYVEVFDDRLWYRLEFSIISYFRTLLLHYSVLVSMYVCTSPDIFHQIKP